MSDITITDANRNQFGGDYNLTRTVPKIHPKLGIPLAATREALGDGGVDLTSFLRGDIIFKDDPTREFVFHIWTDDGGHESRKLYMLLKRKGYETCRPADWDLRPELRQMWQTENDMLVLRGNSLVQTRPTYDVLMYCSAEHFKAEEEKEQRKQYGSLQTHGSQKIGEAVTDKRVEVMPTTIEVIQHRYNPEAADAKAGS